MQAKKERRLAAVMFADIVGYTALMQRDEHEASLVRDRHRAVFEQQHKLHGGQIMMYYGDGVLSVFKSAIQAAQCAIDIQKLLREPRPVPLKIGLHMGDIVFDQTEIYGDGVNLASRIESMGIAGAILLSAKLNDELKNHLQISTSSLGHFDLKNIAAPVEVFAITNDGIRVPALHELAGKQATKSKSIAVLPFVNMSAHADNEYFSDGMTEEIINALAGIKELRVTSRTSSFYFKGKQVPVKQIAAELGVSTILEGSVRLAGNTLRITAQLINAETDAHFWSESWDRKTDQIFEIQDEISLIIARKLQEHLGHFDIGGQLVRKQTDNYDAYALFLKARFHFRKWNPPDTRIAKGLYERALALDPEHAESIIGLADCYKFLASTGFMPLGEAWGEARELIYRGLRLNDRLADGHCMLANLHFFTECDYQAALAESLIAVKLNPNYVEARQYTAFLYIIAGDREHARQHLDVAVDIDPLSQETLFFQAYFDYMSGDFPTALRKAERCLTENPRNIPAHTLACYCLLHLGRFEKVLRYFDDMPEEIIVAGDKLGITALAYTMAGDTAKAAACLEELKAHAATQSGFRQSSFLMYIHAVAGNTELAFEWIYNALENRAPFLLIHFVDPFVQSLKEDRRYAEIYRQIFPGVHPADAIHV